MLIPINGRGGKTANLVTIFETQSEKGRWDDNIHHSTSHVPSRA